MGRTVPFLLFRSEETAAIDEGTDRSCICLMTQKVSLQRSLQKPFFSETKLQILQMGKTWTNKDVVLNCYFEN